MISMFLLILSSIVVTLLLFKSEEKEKFLFSPYHVDRGENMQGLFLSHFSHANPGHLIFNMLSFYFFAPVLVQMEGETGLLFVYLAAGMGADALIYILRREDPRYRCLGASGSVVGVIFAAIVFRPEMNIFMFFIPIPIPAPIFAIGYILISLYMMRQEGGGVSHEAHIGGAICGFLAGALLSDTGLDPLLRWLNTF